MAHLTWEGVGLSMTNEGKAKILVITKSFGTGNLYDLELEPFEAVKLAEELLRLCDTGVSTLTLIHESMHGPIG